MIKISKNVLHLRPYRLQMPQAHLDSQKAQTLKYIGDNFVISYTRSEMNQSVIRSYPVNKPLEDEHVSRFLWLYEKRIECYINAVKRRNGFLILRE